MAVVCPECGEHNPDGAKLCGMCGIVLSHVAPPSPHASPPPAPSSYFPPPRPAATPYREPAAEIADNVSSGLDAISFIAGLFGGD